MTIKEDCEEYKKKRRKERGYETKGRMDKDDNIDNRRKESGDAGRN